MSTNCALAIAIQAGVPILTWGPPGVGKTASITMLADGLALPLEVVLASIREPSDFSGLPVIGEEGVRMEPPAWAHRLARAGKGVLFLDEISTAPPAVQSALLRVVLDRVVGDLALPNRVTVVASANPPEQAVGGWDLSAPLANRFCHLFWSLDTQGWVDGMIGGWSISDLPHLPSSWENSIREKEMLVAAFVRHRPHLLLQVPKDEGQAGKAWPSPRSWSMTARLLAAAESVLANEDVVATLTAGCIGEGACLEFLAWCRDLDLPDPEDILANPTYFRLPDRGDQAFAILVSVIAAAVGRLTEERWSAAWRVLAQASEHGKRDIAAVAAKRLAAARKPELSLPLKEVQEFAPLLQKGGLM
ncbi:AAA family ATPase [Desulfosporosinus meridiei]|uniref:ATPase family protein associated with various cellular activities (AAA) n=1 Tax=Desulfosporosinus meridiei (strain ATCC BAA-275 / DSM 13257 / KCTC 12902 / NCIMB 13706 / S10) TaxID=768704 RepID=J7J318_DESMD|nr:MoxR family ATPase [Desulfosporosinus meridiei]AFQ45346.1 ATPase family protein associated with various cellular activities (AAA) [Desulfosporosinus meridiei DSM 13257]